MSTRPRITFDARGRCNACQWAERKAELDWTPRQLELESLLSPDRPARGPFDCLVPVSGGKDGSYVAYQIRETYGGRPLCVTVTPPLATQLGSQNLRRFADSGYDLIQVNPNAEAMRQLNRYGLIEMGFPYYGWLLAIHSAVIRTAEAFGIDLIFYGEDGEVEYGGDAATQDKPFYDFAYISKIYLEGGLDKVWAASDLDPQDQFWFSFPSQNAFTSSLRITHWSYYEAWDPYRNYLVAKEYCGLIEANDTNTSTFTNFAQNDQELYALHTYLMYLKFGFGRATQDAGIEIRRGSMTREQGLNLVRMYDGQFPDANLSTYLDYFQMTRTEFEAALDRWVNKDLFVKENGRWKPTFTVQ